MTKGACFNGAALSRARSPLRCRKRRRRCSSFNGAALSRARSQGIVGLQRARRGASTGPRSRERGVRNLRRTSPAVSRLQRGRALASAESCKSTYGQKHTSFNGAALSRARSPPSTAPPMPAFLASTGPRSRERGVEPNATPPSCALVLLQRGRALASAESRVYGFPRARPGRFNGAALSRARSLPTTRWRPSAASAASTGPRSRERGVALGATATLVYIILASTGPRSRERGVGLLTATDVANV